MCFWQTFREACPLKKAFPWRLLSQGSSEVRVPKCRDSTPSKGSPLTLYSPMCVQLLTYVTSFMYSNRWLMDEIVPTVFTVTGSLTFEFSGGHGLSRVFSAHKQHSWSCPHVSSLVWSKEWPMVEGFSPFIGFLTGCELPCLMTAEIWHAEKGFSAYVTPNCVFLHHPLLYISILHPTVCAWMNEVVS